MSGMELFLKLRQHGKAHLALQDFCSENIEKILKHLPVRILKSDGDLNDLFSGLSDEKNLQYKIKVVDIVLTVLRKESVSLSHCGNIISRVCLELPRLAPTAVVRWCDESVESIRDDNDVNMIWRDVLPECLNAISSLDTVSCNNSVVPVTEYRTQVLQKLLQCKWKDDQLVQLTAMFKDLQLSRREHREFVVKICSLIKDMRPDSLPPLVHQLLKLCKVYNVDVVLAHLSHYFNLRLYSKLLTFSQDSESTTMDVDDIEEFSVSELQICLSTCVYHATDAAEPEALRRQLRAWPRSQLAREPFLVSVALAMMEKGAEFKAVCLDVLRLAIEQAVADEARRKEFAWMRRVLPSTLDLDEMLKELATGGGNHRSATWTGLIQLCFALLASGRGPEPHACAARGVATLARLARAHPCTAPSILATLADRLAADSGNPHYIECLRTVCATAPLSVEPCAQLGGIVERCRPAPGARAVYAAVRPLLNYSERLRDVLVMVCRKGLYSRDSAHRCLAASGILTVLKHLRVSGAAVTSTQVADDSAAQCSQSYMSVLTVEVHASQLGVSVGSRASKETICHEMVSILRRCLGQDAAVKQLLYTGWYSSVKDKPSLHNSLLDMLHEHLSQYFPETGGKTTLLIDKCVQNAATNPVLIEPIGYLLYLIAQLLQSPDDDLESILATQAEEENLTRKKLKNIMADLSECNLLQQIDMNKLAQWDSSVESKAKVIKVQQLLQVYEALVAHHVLQWSADDGRADAVFTLLKGYAQLLDNTKSPPRLAKKTNKSNETTDSLKGRRSHTSPKSQRDADPMWRPRKIQKTVKDKNSTFKPLRCLWDLKLCYRILELLYSADVPWSSSRERAALRGRRVVHTWTARAVTSVLRRAHDDAYASVQVPRIAALLYERCLCRFEDLYNFDAETTLGCLKMFHACLELLNSLKYNYDAGTYLSKICSTTKIPVLNKTTLLNKTRIALLVAEQSLADADCLVNRRIVKLVADVIVATLRIPTDLHLELSREVSKLEEHVRMTRHEYASLCAPLLAVAAADSWECTLLEDLIARLTDVLADQTTEDSQSTQETVEFPWLQASVAGAVRAHVTTHLLSRFACAKHTIASARDLARALSLAVAATRPTVEKELNEARYSCVLQLCQAALAVRALCALPGAGATRGAGGGGALALRLYTLAADLLRTMDVDAAQEAGVVRLLQVMGDELTRVVRAARDGWDGKLVPRLVHAAESFRSQVYRLDKKGQCGYKEHLSELVAPGAMRLQTGAAESVASDAVDDTRDEDDATNGDSDAESVIIQRRKSQSSGVAMHL